MKRFCGHANAEPRSIETRRVSEAGLPVPLLTRRILMGRYAVRELSPFRLGRILLGVVFDNSWLGLLPAAQKREQHNGRQTRKDQFAKATAHEILLARVKRIVTLDLRPITVTNCKGAARRGGRTAGRPYGQTRRPETSSLGASATPDIFLPRSFCQQLNNRAAKTR
jgi:hypothetical protein